MRNLTNPPNHIDILSSAFLELRQPGASPTSWRWVGTCHGWKRQELPGSRFPPKNSVIGIGWGDESSITWGLFLSEKNHGKIPIGVSCHVESLFAEFGLGKKTHIKDWGILRQPFFSRDGWCGHCAHSEVFQRFAVDLLCESWVILGW